MLTNLNLNQLRVFHVASETRSFTRAAGKLNLTQPGVSKHIKGLEAFFGTPLFDRLGRKLSLTAAGEILFEATQRVFHSIEESRKRIDDLESSRMGQLRIGASMTLGIYILLPYVKRFRSYFPGIDVSMNISLSREIETKVLNNTLDLGFIGSPAQDERLVTGKLLDDELILVLPPDHPWIHRKTIRVRNICSGSLLVSQPGSGTRIILEDRFKALGTSPSFVEIGHAESIKRAVEAGLGISILSRSVVERDLKMGWVRTVQLKGIDLKRTFYYIYRGDKYLSSAARAFLSLISNKPYRNKNAGLMR
jgi:DNA-binding transcriptional LysR family regulator